MRWRARPIPRMAAGRMRGGWRTARAGPAARPPPRATPCPTGARGPRGEHRSRPTARRHPRPGAAAAALSETRRPCGEWGERRRAAAAPPPPRPASPGPAAHQSTADRTLFWDVRPGRVSSFPRARYAPTPCHDTRCCPLPVLADGAGALAAEWVAAVAVHTVPARLVCAVRRGLAHRGGRRASLPWAFRVSGATMSR